MHLSTSVNTKVLLWVFSELVISTPNKVEGENTTAFHTTKGWGKLGLDIIENKSYLSKENKKSQDYSWLLVRNPSIHLFS